MVDSASQCQSPYDRACCTCIVHTGGAGSGSRDETRGGRAAPAVPSCASMGRLQVIFHSKTTTSAPLFMPAFKLLVPAWAPAPPPLPSLEEPPCLEDVPLPRAGFATSKTSSSSSASSSPAEPPSTSLSSLSAGTIRCFLAFPLPPLADESSGGAALGTSLRFLDGAGFGGARCGNKLALSVRASGGR